MERLLLGQVGDPSQGLPAGAGSALWWLSEDSFGQQVGSTAGADSPLYIETDDVEFGATVLLRRVRVPFAYTGAPVVRVTAVLDQNRAGGSWTVALPASAEEVQRPVVVRLLKRCHMLRLAIEVLSSTARIAFLGRIGVSFKPVTGATALVTAEATP
jgi:hypothetical protein